MITRPSHKPARHPSGMAADFENMSPIYENMLHAFGILMRFFESCMILNGTRIKYDNICRKRFSAGAVINHAIYNYNTECRDGLEKNKNKIILQNVTLFVYVISLFFLFTFLISVTSFC